MRVEKEINFSDWERKVAGVKARSDVKQNVKNVKSFLHRFGQMDEHTRFQIIVGSSYMNGPTII